MTRAFGTPEEGIGSGRMLMETAVPSRPLHVLGKPIGPICNLDCKYCFYLEKEKLYPPGEKWGMSDAVLEAYVRQYIAQQPGGEVNFAWQGGEPTLLGVDFFKRAVALQRRYAGGKTIHNALQTNGTLLDDAWGEFLARNQFLVGLSIDGPRLLHDRYRVDKHQQPTFDAVIAGLAVLKKHGVAFNTLTGINRENARQPMAVYRFLQQIGSEYLQFIPLVERQASGPLTVLTFAEPVLPGETNSPNSPVTPWSVDAADYGTFLCTIFDHWVRHDVGRTFVQMFDVALGQWMNLPSSLCVFAPRCGSALALEHNGDLYSCDHYVYPRYRLGNLLNESLTDLAELPQQRRFGNDKSDTLPKYCRTCSVRFACNGECPKHRFITTPDGEAGLNYLCPAYKRFFTHVDPHMKMMRDLLRAGRPAADIMPMLRTPIASSTPVGRNDTCPCGSGSKFKRCCGARA